MAQKGWIASPTLMPTPGTGAAAKRAEPEVEESVDLERLARDEIAKLIVRNFSGHDMARLVEAVLKAQGYTTFMSPPGPDKGIDILTNGFSKKLENHSAAVALHYMHYNFVRIHRTLRVTPGHASGPDESRVEYRRHHRPVGDGRKGACCMKPSAVVDPRVISAVEQRAIASRFTALQSAIERGSPTMFKRYEALCKVYRGKSSKFLHGFASARDKSRWAWRLETYLFAEIEPEFWPIKGHRR